MYFEGEKGRGEKIGGEKLQMSNGSRFSRGRKATCRSSRLDRCMLWNSYSRMHLVSGYHKGPAVCTSSILWSTRPDPWMQEKSS